MTADEIVAGIRADLEREYPDSSPGELAVVRFIYETRIAPLRTVVQELYGWIATELDPNPEPIESYVVGEKAQEAARWAL